MLMVICFQMEGMDDLEGELRDEDIQQDSPDDSRVSLLVRASDQSQRVERIK